MSGNLSDPEHICARRQAVDDRLGLRIAALWVILVTSLLGALFPVVAKRVPFLRRTIPAFVFEFAKHFSAGVILATAIVHLLEPAVTLLSDSACVSAAWAEYPYAYGLCMIAVYFSFVAQILAARYGHRKVGRLAVAASAVDVDRDLEASAAADAPPAKETSQAVKLDESTIAFTDASERENTLASQLVAVATLEFGICFHSVIIGLTLAVTDSAEFVPLFVVLIFHQMFEGLGVGARLTFLQLDGKYAWLPWAGGLLYALCTPVGMAIGLGVHEGLALNSEALSLVSGVFYALSSGILLYTATVELMAHEIVFARYYHTCAIGRLTFTLLSFALGAGIMALLGKWA
ncbi:hypothetical protein JCM10207_006033 [Rhodosporidiobolus poonsookiae]